MKIADELHIVNYGVLNIGCTINAPQGAGATDASEATTDDEAQPASVGSSEPSGPSGEDATIVAAASIETVATAALETVTAASIETVATASLETVTATAAVETVTATASIETADKVRKPKLTASELRLKRAIERMFALVRSGKLTFRFGYQWIAVMRIVAKTGMVGENEYTAFKYLIDKVKAQGTEDVHFSINALRQKAWGVFAKPLEKWNADEFRDFDGHGKRQLFDETVRIAQVFRECWNEEGEDKLPELFQ